MKITLNEATRKTIEDALSRNKSVEVGVRNGKLIVWELHSKKKSETALA